VTVCVDDNNIKKRVSEHEITSEKYINNRFSRTQCWVW